MGRKYPLVVFHNSLFFPGDLPCHVARAILDKIFLWEVDQFSTHGEIKREILQLNFAWKITLVDNIYKGASVIQSHLVAILSTLLPSLGRPVTF